MRSGSSRRRRPGSRSSRTRSSRCAPRARRPGCRRSPTTRAWWSTRWGAPPGCARRATRVTARATRTIVAKAAGGARRRRAAGPRRRVRLRARLPPPRKRRVPDRLRGSLERPHPRRAERRRRLRLRSRVHRRDPRPDRGRALARGEERGQPPRPGARAASRPTRRLTAAREPCAAGTGRSRARPTSRRGFSGSWRSGAHRCGFSRSACRSPSRPAAAVPGALRS